MTSVATTPCTSCQGSEQRGLERTRFFARQIVTPDDLTQDQIYFRENSKRHNRILHGWGVVCGACVRRGPGACDVIVEPGYVLGPFGDEIVIDREVTVDVCKLGAGEQDGCCDQDLDPWCADDPANCSEGTMYLAVKYSECRTRPVRGGGGCGCGCDDSECEYSRIRDGYTFKLLRELPAGYTTPMKQPPFSVLDSCRGNKARPCAPCATDPWVILADVSITADCKVRAVSCFTHRRYVVSFADFFLVCASPSLTTGATVGMAGVNPIFAHASNTMMSMMTGTSALMDTSMTMSNEAPRAMVSLTRADGSTTMLPAYFAVERGSTVADLLEREGAREYFDPATQQTYTLRDIYRSARVAPSTRLDSASAALSPLEGKRLSGGTSSTDERVAPATVDDVAAAPATSLANLSEDSALAKRLAGLTVGDVGDMTHAEFVAHATKGARARQKKQITDQADKIWREARRATSAYAPEPGGMEDMNETDETKE
jgi:hypothetical protein